MVTNICSPLEKMFKMIVIIRILNKLVNVYRVKKHVKTIFNSKRQTFNRMLILAMVLLTKKERLLVGNKT